MDEKFWDEVEAEETAPVEDPAPVEDVAPVEDPAPQADPGADQLRNQVVYTIERRSFGDRSVTTIVGGL